MARVARFLLVGLVMSYAGLRALLGTASRERRAPPPACLGRHSRRGADAPGTPGRSAADAPLPAPAPSPACAVPPRLPTRRRPGPRRNRRRKPGGLLARMPGLMRRPDPEPEPELVDRSYHGEAPEAPGPDRIRAKIADVIRARRAESEPAEETHDKPLTKGRGRAARPARPAR